MSEGSPGLEHQTLSMEDLYGEADDDDDDSDDASYDDFDGGEEE